ncbi:hypothetical protein KVR01_010758 [Diaporthe batatas]|uniref:uncharacterized protein n=1 Tax=Diaporthe batatas TaxID=748121 RepID=UPI001D055D33|nr:uncharacterized protein KVR01_010758 [Diaporthe batatas]KAG8159097.1 hypothetical protein KVR01_010758 [Diaporthe batatas]
MSLSPERSKSLLSYLSGAHRQPNQKASLSSTRQPFSERPQRNSTGVTDVRSYPTYTPRTDEHRYQHRRHKSSRSLDYRSSYRGDQLPHQPESKHQRQDDRRHSHTSQAGKSTIYLQSPLESPGRREPTLADARKHHIAPGRCLKHWDPDKEPILLLTSVFDTFSLGKWALGQTARIYGEQDEMTDLATEFWLEHRDLGTNIKHAKSHLPQITDPGTHERVSQSITSGGQLVNQLGEVLKRCEQRVLEVTGINEIPKLGHKSVVVFIDTFIGRNPAQQTAFRNLIRSMRTWNNQFDAECLKLMA